MSTHNEIYNYASVFIHLYAECINLFPRPAMKNDYNFSGLAGMYSHPSLEAPNLRTGREPLLTLTALCGSWVSWLVAASSSPLYVSSMLSLFFLKSIPSFLL